MAANKLAILTCMNPSCRFRFHTEKTAQKHNCPKCGAAMQSQHIIIDTTPSQEPFSTIKNYPMEILLDNIRSAYNVGAILRSADGVGVTHAHICGITPPPIHPKVQKTGLFDSECIPWTQHWNAVEAVTEAKTRGAFICCLETQEGSLPLFSIGKDTFRFPVLLVAGNEVSGVDPGILEISDLVIHIPMFGSKNSLNVSSAFSIAAYFIRQFGISSRSP